MAVGLPCVVTNVGGSGELVRDGETGFLVPARDAAALSERICQLIDDADLRRSMGAAGRQAVQAYDVEKMAATYLDLYRELNC